MVWESIKHFPIPLKLHKEVLNPAFGGMKFLGIAVVLIVYFAAISSCFASDNFKWEDIYPGVKYLFYNTQVKECPVKFYVVLIDIKLAKAKIIVSPSEYKNRKPSEFAKAIGAQIAINGSIWRSAFVPLGLTVFKGNKWPETKDNNRYGFFAVTEKGQVWISLPEEVVDFTPYDIYMAISGYPMVVRKGKAAEICNCGYVCLKHPRTAVGIDKFGKKIFFIVAEGRRKDSVSITLGSLAEFMIRIGVWDGLNLDGGGASVLYIKDKGGVVNKLNEKEERLVSNSLAAIIE